MMASFKIQELLDAADGKLIQKGNADFVSGVSTDSRTIGEGELFIALRGDNFDGHDYVSKAVSRKAAAVMVSDLERVGELCHCNLCQGYFICTVFACTFSSYEILCSCCRNNRFQWKNDDKGYAFCSIVICL